MMRTQPRKTKGLAVEPHSGHGTVLAEKLSTKPLTASSKRSDPHSAQLPLGLLCGAAQTPHR